MAALSRGALFAALLSTSCFDPGEGVEPPLNRIYFPTGIALNLPPTHGALPERNPTRLYLVNSNFDLQFNGGSLQSYDLDRIRGFVPSYCTTNEDCTGKCASEPCRCASLENPGAPSWCVEDPRQPCGALGVKSPAELKLTPGMCKYVDIADALVGSGVGIGAFATDVLYRERPGGAPGEGRLFVPVRGDATLHWLDVTDSAIDCGQAGNGGDCDDNHRAGDDPDEESTRGLRLPPEPYGIDASDSADTIVVTHQVNGRVSLFLQEAWGAPQLQFVQEGLPSRVIDVAAIPPPRSAGDPEQGFLNGYEQGFLITFRNAAEIDLLRYQPDTLSSPARPFLYRSQAIAIRANALGFDSRGIAIDARVRKECEAGCNEAAECLRTCAAEPLGVYIANRSPETLLVGRTSRPDSTVSGEDNSFYGDELPTITDTIDLAPGPSRVVIGTIIDKDGNLATRVFVVCFDSHSIYVYDPRRRIRDSIISTGRGPHAFVTDVDVEGRDAGKPAHAFGYVAHFTDSYLGVIDLDQRHARTYGTIIATLAKPTQPRAQK
jgi:hypothetical protein